MPHSKTVRKRRSASLRGTVDTSMEIVPRNVKRRPTPTAPNVVLFNECSCARRNLRLSDENTRSSHLGERNCIYMNKHSVSSAIARYFPRLPVPVWLLLDEESLLARCEDQDEIERTLSNEPASPGIHRGCGFLFFDLR